MPDSPVFAITYPCEGSQITPADFATFAFDVEAALATVDATATAAEHRPYANGAWSTLNPTVATETTVTFSAPSSSSSGITMNTGAGTLTIITPGIYRISVTTSNGPQSSLTMTSQRASIFKNAALVLTKRYRGTNPTGISCTGGSFSADLNLVAGDVITISYLWTGTGTINGAGGANGDFDVSYLMNA